MMHSILILFTYLKKQFLLNIRRYNYNWLLLKFEYFMSDNVSEISILSLLKFNKDKVKNWEKISFKLKSFCDRSYWKRIYLVFAFCTTIVYTVW